MNPNASLILIPTPLNPELPLGSEAWQCLARGQGVVAVEEHKVARRRWLRWGLPREAIADFLLYNEHSWRQALEDLTQAMGRGRQVFLMSDGGLPAFCDPGRALVERCHQQGLTVTATSFENAPLLALALSGFSHQQFHFFGFPPFKERRSFLERFWRAPTTSLLMETPYRLGKVLGELAELARPQDGRTLCLAYRLGYPDERVRVGSPRELAQEFAGLKGEFVLVAGEHPAFVEG